MERLTNPRTTYGLLIVWTIWGFYTNLDYTLNRGCISSESSFTMQNSLYSGTAIALLSIGFFMTSRRIGLVILTCELLFWLYKLFLVKGGYVVGFGGLPSIDVLVFDTIALTLRLVVIKKVSQLQFKTIFVLIISFIIMTIKLQFFR